VLLNVIMRGPVTRPIDPTKRAERRELGNPTHPLDLARINEVTLKAALLCHIVTGHVGAVCPLCGSLQRPHIPLVAPDHRDPGQCSKVACGVRLRRTRQRAYLHLRIVR